MPARRRGQSVRSTLNNAMAEFRLFRRTAQPSPGADRPECPMFSTQNLVPGPHDRVRFRVTVVWRAFSTFPSRRSEEHTSELQSLMRISYAVFCLKKKKNKHTTHHTSAHK